MRNANDEIMKKPSPKTKQSLQAANSLKPKVVEHKNKVQPQVCEARPHRADLSSLFPACSCCEASLFRTVYECV